MYKHNLIVIILLLFITVVSKAQFLSKIQLKSHFNQARRAILFNNYSKALPNLQFLLKKDSINANYNYLVGLCYYNIPLKKANALPYFLMASKNTTKNYKELSFKETSAPYKTYKYIGDIYHYIYNFDKAKNYYTKYLEYMTPNSSEYKEVKRLIEICNYANELMNDSIEISIENLGMPINSEYDEHSPVLLNNEEEIIFTSRRKGTTGGLLADDGRYFEDIFVSRKNNDKWTKPEKISPNINTERHEASICISSDGQELYIYRDDYGIGNIYVSYLDENRNWTKPEKLEPQISSSANETHATISADKNMLIFSSDRAGGFGGKDLYVSLRLPNGNWGIPKNLGPNINTQYDEEGPFLMPDGYTLYFSSKGHNTIGGYDLFFSELQEDGTWGKPKNLGYPINTTDDEVYYFVSADEKRAYFSSIREDSYGGKDIYVMNLLSLPERSSAVVKGRIYIKGQESNPVKDVVIKVYDNKTNKLMGQYKPNKETGYYVMILKQNREYTIKCENKDCEFEPSTFFVPENSSLFEIDNPIVIEPISKIEIKD
jgi:hypothetical protein